MGAADDFRELLAPGAIRAVFQPIVRLSDLGADRLRGARALPDAARPRRAAAGRHARRRRPLGPARRARGRLLGGDRPRPACRPQGRLLFVNVSPEALGHPGLLELAGKLPSRLVIELTEQDAVQNHALLRERLRPWIARGALVAVDDAGAGFTSLEYVAEIRPDFLKLCRGMVAGVDLDAPARPSCAPPSRSPARSARAIVAEGVERAEELAMLRDDEVDYGQGWLFGRPGEAWPRDPRHRRACRRPRRRPPAGSSATCVRSLHAPDDASEAVVEHLARRGLLPGVYLAQGGRLRYQAARGFWQVYDGMPPSAGVVGRVFRTGVAAVLDDVGEAPDYLPSVPGIRAEVCLPLTISGRVVGVLNAESVTRDRRRDGDRVERCAGLLTARLEEVGASVRPRPRSAWPAPPPAWPSLEDPEDVVRETLAAALELAGFESALRRARRRHGGLYPHRAEGSFASSSPSSLPRRSPRSPTGSTAARRPTRSREPPARLRRPRGAAPHRRRLAWSCCRSPSRASASA